MPCSDWRAHDYSDEIGKLRKQIGQLEAMLCEVAQSGVALPKTVAAWYQKHELKDRRRREAQKQERVLARARLERQIAEAQAELRELEKKGD